jgi:hypothetical protein
MLANFRGDRGMHDAYLSPRDEADVSNLLKSLQQDMERSSNFRFAWQFFDCGLVDGMMPWGAKAILDRVIADEPCHRFLKETFDPMYDPSFKVEPIHEHASIEPARGNFENILAAAANDHLGAYSGYLRDATPKEAAKIRAVFEQLGPYEAFELLPGSQPSCEVCRQHNNHLFSRWFYRVAWDWCFVLTWPQLKRAWVGCLTDTD